MWPAISTLVGRPNAVRASIELPSRNTSNRPSARSADSTASAIGPSPRDTDGMSTSVAVRSAGSADRSRVGTARTYRDVTLRPSTVPHVRKPIAWTVAGLALAGVLVAAVVLGIHLVSSSSNPTPTAECTVPGRAPAGSAVQPSTVYLSAVQLQHASTINAVGMSRGLPERARIIALATALQESGLRNLPSGDRDSVGLFQQRPSQGWGPKVQLLDPVYAAGKFYDALVKVAGWQKMTLTKAAQSVQYSGFPDAYAKWEDEATTLAVALGGAAPLSLTCIAGAQAPTADAPSRKPLAGSSTAPPALVDLLAAAEAELGGLKLVAHSGSTAVVTVTVPGVPTGQGGRALAAWGVAHGTGFTVTTVSVERQKWAEQAWDVAPTTQPAGRVSITAG